MTMPRSRGKSSKKDSRRRNSPVRAWANPSRGNKIVDCKQTHCYIYDDENC